MAEQSFWWVGREKRGVCKNKVRSITVDGGTHVGNGERERERASERARGLDFAAAAAAAATFVDVVANAAVGHDKFQGSHSRVSARV